MYYSREPVPRRCRCCFSLSFLARKNPTLSITFCRGGSTHTSLHFILYCIEGFLMSKCLLGFTLGTRGFFSRVTRTFVGRKPTRLRPKAEETSGEAARKKFSRGSLFKTWPKPETAHEKPLAPRVAGFGLGPINSWVRVILYLHSNLNR